MKKEFMNLLVRSMIERSDYMPVRNEDGNLKVDDEINILTKNSFGSFIIVELLDGDKLSCEEIATRLEGNKRTLSQMKSGSARYFFEVFVFETAPTQEKLDAIKSGQFQMIMGKKYIKCLSVSLKSRTVERHFKVPVTDMGLGKTIKLVMENDILDENVDIEDMVLQKQKEYELKYAAKVPVFTYILIAMNIIIWLAMNIYSLTSGTNVNQLLLDFGAKENFHILSGEYWRFITPIFLHANIIHLLLNCYSLYVIGILVEKIFGHTKFLVVYFVAGVLGNIASFMFSMSMGVGASGAIFGLLGALLYFGLQKPVLFKVYFGNNVIFTIVINLGYGFSRSGIDNYAHIGGLIGGFFATGAVCLPDKTKWYLNRVLYILLAVVITVSGLLYGFNNKHSKIVLKVNKMEQLDKEQKWSEVIKVADEVLTLKPNDNGSKASVYWSLARAEALTGNYGESVEYAKKLIELDPQDGHSLLGAIYFDMGRYQDSKNELLEAKKLNVVNQNIDQTLSEIDKILSGNQ